SLHIDAIRPRNIKNSFRPSFGPCFRPCQQSSLASSGTQVLPRTSTATRDGSSGILTVKCPHCDHRNEFPDRSEMSGGPEPFHVFLRGTPHLAFNILEFVHNW